MLVNNQVQLGEYRHNIIRMAFVIGTLLLFIGYIIVNQTAERNYSSLLVNGTLRAEEIVLNDITPSYWVYRCLNAINYFWQLAWLFYSLTLLYRRSTGGYLYLSPNTLTPKFYITYILGFAIQAIWLLFFHRNYVLWTWIVYLVAFLLLSLALFIINNNIAVNRKLYEIEGFNQDIWYLRFFAQNGVAFFACWTAVRFVLAFNAFLQLKCNVSIANSGTICLLIAGLIALGYFFGPNLNSALFEKCAYQCSPWIVFIIFFWGVVEGNWVSHHVTRNNIIALIELIICVLTALAALALFTLRYRSSKIDPVA